VLICMTRLYPELLGAARIVKPETILRWHRAGYKMYWRWKSRKGQFFMLPDDRRTGWR
jgi:hypothetical protein